MAAAHATAAKPRAVREPAPELLNEDAPGSADSDEAQASVWQIFLGRVRASVQRLLERARLAALSKIERVIALLQRLRLKLGAADAKHDRRGGGAAGRGQAAEGRQGGAEEGAPPPPKQRLRKLLFHSLAMLIGAVVGMALSFQLLEHLLDQRSTELTRVEVKLAKNLKSIGRLQSQAERAREKQELAEERLAKKTEESEAKLSELDAQRLEAEAQRARMEARLERALEARPASAPRAEAPRQASAARTPLGAPPRSGNCTLGGGDVGSVLKGCIDEMDRK